GLPHTSPDDATAVAERLIQNVETLRLGDEFKDLQLSVTVGVAVACAEDDLDTLITRADNRLYEGKRNGRNKVVAC
ncbi:MAG TPA: hypothetical protein DCF92_11735, partial [Idiomarina sp.]|nr:hypothetical protein [Idiomarina sp.]